MATALQCIPVFSTVKFFLAGPVTVLPASPQVRILKIMPTSNTKLLVVVAAKLPQAR